MDGAIGVRGVSRTGGVHPLTLKIASTPYSPRPAWASDQWRPHAELINEHDHLFRWRSRSAAAKKALVRRQWGSDQWRHHWQLLGPMADNGLALAQDLVGLAKLAVLALERLEFLAL